MSNVKITDKKFKYEETEKEDSLEEAEIIKVIEDKAIEILPVLKWIKRYGKVHQEYSFVNDKKQEIWVMMSFINLRYYLSSHPEGWRLCIQFDYFKNYLARHKFFSEIYLTPRGIKDASDFKSEAGWFIYPKTEDINKRIAEILKSLKKASEQDDLESYKRCVVPEGWENYKEPVENLSLNENGKIIRLVDNSYFEMTNNVTFADFNNYIKNNPGLEGFVKEPFLYDLGDSGKWKYIKEFIDLTDKNSQNTIYNFYLDRKMFNPKENNFNEDLKTFYHLRFIS